MKMFRAFIAVEVPFTEELKNLWGEVKASGARVKMVEPENVHITLKFLGNIPENLVPEILKAITKSCSGISPFKVSLTGCGAFPTPNRPRVVWVGVSEGEEELKRIAYSLEKELSKLGFEKEKREFVPHLTIARVKGSIGKLPEVIRRNANKKFGEFEVKEVRLMKSTLTPTGPIYEVIGSVKL